MAGNERADSAAPEGGRVPSQWKEVLDPEAPSALVLRTLYGSEAGVELAEEFHQRVEASIGGFANPNTGQVLSGNLQAIDAWHLLEQLHEVLATRVMALAATRGSAEWLWFLRRLRGQFHINEWNTTDPYVQAVAEVLASGDSRPSQPDVDDRFTFGVDGGVLKDLFWLREVAIMVYQLHSTMKRCAKGQSIAFVPGQLPNSVPDRRLDQAINRYDERVQRAESNVFQSVGVDPGAGPDLTLTFGNDHRLGGVVPCWYPTATPRSDFLLPEDPPPTLPQWIDLDMVPPLREQPILKNEHVSLIALLWACFNIGIREEKHMVRRLSPALQWGYMVVPHERFLLLALDEMAEWLRKGHGEAITSDVLPENGAAIIETLASLRPSVWPPISGNPLHRAGDVSLVDLVAASRRLTGTLLRPRDGADVNVWSDHFEADVQAIIDTTRWAPPEPVRAAIGRTVRREDGSAITDVDAIAECNGKLLLVSCKSVAFTVPAAGGKHEAVREITRKAEQAAEEWAHVLQTVREKPRVLNLPLAADVDIDGCVIFPAVPFYTDGRWDREVVPGLPFLASSSELREALSQT